MAPWSLFASYTGYIIVVCGVKHARVNASGWLHGSPTTRDDGTNCGYDAVVRISIEYLDPVNIKASYRET